MPPPLAGLRVERQHGVAEQVVPGPIAAVIVVRGRLGGHVEQAELRVRRHGRPMPDVPRVPPRGVEELRTLLHPVVGAGRHVPEGLVRRQPGLDAELSLLRDRVEAPEHPARAGVVRHDVAGHVHGPDLVGRGPGGNAAGMHRDRCDEGIAENRRRRRVGHPARPLRGRTLTPAQVVHHVHRAGRTEILHEIPSPGVQGHQLVARRHHEDALISRPIRPVGHAAPGAPRNGFDDVAPPALVVARVPVPDGLAGGGIEGNHAALVADGRIENAVDHDGTDLRPAGWRRRALVPRTPSPGHLQIPDVAGMNLVERRIAGGARVRPEHAPFPIGGAVLSARANGSHQTRDGRNRRATDHQVPTGKRSAHGPILLLPPSVAGLRRLRRATIPAWSATRGQVLSSAAC